MINVKSMKLFSLVFFVSILITGCVDKTDTTNIAETNESTTIAIITTPTGGDCDVIESSSLSEDSLEENTQYLPNSISGNLLTEVNEQTLNLNLSQNEYVADACNEGIAVLRLNYNGSADSEITTVDSSEVRIVDLDGNTVSSFEIDNTNIPLLKFDCSNIIHAFFWDGISTTHIAYDIAGNELSDSSYSLNFQVYAEASAFDTNGYFYSLSYDWSTSSKQAVMISPAGEIVASKNESNSTNSIITVNGVPYMVRQNENSSYIDLIPVAEYVQNLDYERIRIEDIGAIYPFGGLGGFYYYDLVNHRICAYDIESFLSIVLLENVPNAPDHRIAVGDEFIVVSSGCDSPTILR